MTSKLRAPALRTTAPADGVEAGKHQCARDARRAVKLPGVALLGEASAISVSVLDLSYDGCRAETTVVLLPGTYFTLSVLGFGKIPASVRWYSNGFAGLLFSPDPIEPATETPRQHERASLKAKIRVRRAGQKNYIVETSDFSPSGCRIEFVDRPSTGERHWIKFDGLDAIEAEVRWVEGFSAGLNFVNPIYPSVYDLLLTKLRG